jgi:hypothetical protein
MAGTKKNLSGEEGNHGMNRDPLKDPKEGDLWDEGSGINGDTFLVTSVGAKRVMYRKLIDGPERSVLRASFRQYMRRYCTYGAFRPDLLERKGITE